MRTAERRGLPDGRGDVLPGEPASGQSAGGRGVLVQRLLTGVVGGILIVACVWAGGIWLAGLFALIAVVSTLEIASMIKIRVKSPEFVIALTASALIVLWPQFERFWFVLFYSLLLLTVFRREAFSFSNAAVLFAAALYASYAFRTLLDLRAQAGFGWVMLVLFVIWATDTGAYFSGRLFGGRKLLPEVSPKKTVSGAIGGLCLAIAVTVSLGFVLRPGAAEWIRFAVFGLAVSVTGQLGDLVESALKRHYAVKDSGRILPGHGGLLDRFDSLLLAAPIAYHLLVWLFGSALR